MIRRRWRPCKQVVLLVLVVAQIFIALQPARYYWGFIESLASKPVRGLSKQPWLYVDLPVFGREEEGEKPPVYVYVGIHFLLCFRFVAVGGVGCGSVPLGPGNYLLPSPSHVLNKCSFRCV